MKFSTTINPKNEFDYTPYIKHHLSKLRGQNVIVTVEKPHNKRSNDQNAYYWLILELIANYTGYDSESLHKLFKGMFLPKQAVILNGKRYMLAGSTTDLSKGKFIEYIERIKVEAADLGIMIPSTDEYKKGMDTPDFIG